MLVVHQAILIVPKMLCKILKDDDQVLKLFQILKDDDQVLKLFHLQCIDCRRVENTGAQVAEDAV